MDKISFTGINNLYIGKRVINKFGSSLNSRNEIVMGPKVCTDIKLICKLTDDADGDHLTKFHEALNRCAPYVKHNILGQESDKIDFMVSKIESKDSIKNNEINLLKLNGYDIILDRDDILPIHTFMAYLTKFLAKSPLITDAQKVQLDVINKSIEKEAFDYLGL